PVGVPQAMRPPMADVYLQPGGFYFGKGDVRVHTILGTCVAITLWLPARKTGGMCHYLLPRRPRHSNEPPGLYADEAMMLFMREVQRLGHPAQEYDVGLFGGGHMFRVAATCPFDVAQMNIDAGWRLLRAHGFRVAMEHLGGIGHRRVVLDLDAGRVSVEQFDLSPAGPMLPKVNPC
ncbi:MAG: hypothetical protein AB7U81_15970, partial [Thiohalomonadaceae bacterium]